MTFVPRRVQRSLNNIGEKMEADMAEVKRRAEEGHHKVIVKKGPVDGMSKYQRKQYEKKLNLWKAPEVSVQDGISNGETPVVEVVREMPEVRVESVKITPRFRDAHYVLTPLPNDKTYLDDLVVLNYIFLDSRGNGYRASFDSQKLMSFEHVLEHLSQRHYCLKLNVETRVWKGQRLYFDEGERTILLGDKFSPRGNKLTLVQKLEPRF